MKKKQPQLSSLYVSLPEAHLFKYVSALYSTTCDIGNLENLILGPTPRCPKDHVSLSNKNIGNICHEPLPEFTQPSLSCL